MRKTKVFLQIVSIFIVGFILFQGVSAQTRVERILLKEATRITNDEFSYSATTPLGAKVFAVKKPKSSMLKAIDQGLTDLFAIAKKHKYKNRLNYSDYTIFIANADRTKDGNKSYSPDIAVSAGQYKGSIYDQGGYIYAAGMVMAYNPCAFIIADHTKQFQRVSNVVRFEGEHLVLYHNDRALYNKTADHSQGGGHPILK
jgi:hypothetical protein